MGRTAFLFPGQGVQKTGMGREFYYNFSEVRDLFEQASEIAGFDMQKMCFEEDERLHITEYTQAAIFTVSAAIYSVVKKEGIEAQICAGLSLGEYNAIMATGAISFADAVSVVRKRGILMQEAVPQGIGAMSAVTGLKADAVEAVCRKIEGAEVANYNCPGQIVISGRKEAVEEAEAALQKAGARRCIPLKVSGPFHSSMLESAGRKMEQVLAEIEIEKPVIPYVANVTAEYVTEKEEIKRLLSYQVFSSVRWQQSIERMIADGVDTFVEIGPGKTLTGFMKKINPLVRSFHIETIAELEEVVKWREKVAC